MLDQPEVERGAEAAGDGDFSTGSALKQLAMATGSYGGVAEIAGCGGW
jgi:hypothetical protein